MEKVSLNLQRAQRMVERSQTKKLLKTILNIPLCIKPTPIGTASNPLPPPVPVSAVPVPGLSPVDLLAYERQLGLAKMHPQAQHSLRHVNVAGASAANVAAAHQQLIYYSVVSYDASARIVSQAIKIT
ncbi:unnamed protein product [Brassica oleracea var. botrytis]